MVVDDGKASEFRGGGSLMLLNGVSVYKWR